jgi:hypothetical protein
MLPGPTRQAHASSSRPSMTTTEIADLINGTAGGDYHRVFGVVRHTRAPRIMQDGCVGLEAASPRPARVKTGAKRRVRQLALPKHLARTPQSPGSIAATNAETRLKRYNGKPPHHLGNYYEGSNDQEAMIGNSNATSPNPPLNVGTGRVE